MHSRYVDGIVIRPLRNGDATHHVLVAYVDGDPRPAGFARLVRDGATADVAFEVADEHRGRGIGGALASALAADARAAGIAELHATVAGDTASATSLLARVSRRLSARWLGERRVVAAVD